MADLDDPGTQNGHTGGGTPRDGGPRLGVLVNWAGAAVSLGLIVGMAVWVYQLTVRDVSGVPVIRALEGPMRVPPADPGGTQAEHQGLAVNRIAEGGDAAPVPDRLILAPPPVELDAVALASASAAVRVPETPPAPAPEAGPVAAPEPVMPTPEAVGQSTQALIERLMAQAEPLAGPSATPEADVASDVPSDVASNVSSDAVPAVVIPASVPGPARSLRPATRPEAIGARATSTPASGIARSDVADLEPASLPEGTRLVQLGAFDSPDLARGEWDRLATRFPDYFAGRARVIEEASSGGSPFFRLRAHGFEDLAAARRFCAVLMAQSAPCVPVTVR